MVSRLETGRLEELEQLEENLFIVRGAIEVLPIGRIMTIVRLSDGDLVVHSAVAGPASLMEQIDALGPVRYLVVPNFGHKMDAPWYQERYPGARVVCPEVGRKKVAEVVAVAGGYELLPTDLGLNWELLEGAPAEGVFRVTHDDSSVSLLFTDALLNLPDQLPGFKGWLTRILGSTGGPKVTRIARTFLVKDQRALGAHLRRLAETPGLKRLIVGHGNLVEDDARGVLLRVADTLR